jgi:DNA-binding ferritin-like protein
MENISEVVAGLQELFNQVKYFHWQTKSFAQHEALGGVFEDLEELIDEFVEVAMGKYGRPSTKNQTLEMFDYEDVDMMDWASGVVDLLISYNDVLDETEDSDLLNIRDEMMASLNKLKYLLTLKESKKTNKKVIRLTERDLTRIVERVIKEQYK